MFSIISNSEKETHELGQRIGRQLLPGTVIGLIGTLGTGKTRLTQGIGMGLELPADTITSPTYTLCVPYSGRLRLVHLDTYRIVDVGELDELGLDEVVEDGAVLVIEWADRFEPYLPPLDVQISIEHQADDSRRFLIDALTERGRLELD